MFVPVPVPRFDRCCLVSSSSDRGTILGRIQLPESIVRPDDKALSLPSVLITLNHGEFSTYSTVSDGAFFFHNVPPGVHVLDVHSSEYIFSQVKIQLLADSMNDPKCIEYVYPGAPKQVLTDTPITLTAHGRYEYFQPRPTLSIFSILQNPMILMMIVGAVLMLFMPMMMEGLDDEQKEIMKKQMEAQQDPTKMLSSFFGGGDEEDDKASKKKNKDKTVRKKRE